MKTSAEAVRAELAKLQPEIPWAHHFDLHGVETITAQQNEQFYGKAQAVKILSRIGLSYYDIFSKGLPLSSARVLDVACGEGGIAAAFAHAGAGEVIGVEGRPLYVDRANFATSSLGLGNVRFMLGDVRKIDPALGPFDFTVCSGILHHLGKDDFFPFLQSMAAMTRGVLFLYTHISTPGSIVQMRLEGPVQAEGRFGGYLFREHADDTTAEQREQTVRASLDNTFSFWASEEALVAALSEAGFNMIAKMHRPHAFGNPASRAIRPILICGRDV